MIRHFTDFIFIFVFIALALGSCSTDSRVVSSFGKRKYTKGYYVNLPASKESVTPVLSKPGIKNVKFAYHSISVEIAEKENGVTNIECENNITSFIPSPEIPTTVVSHSPGLKICRTELQELRPDTNINKKIEEGLEEDRKEKKTNRILGIIGCVAAVAGAIILIFSNLFVAGFCLLAGLIISAIGIRRGSNSLLAFFGFIISAIGVILIIAALIAGTTQE
ncbi:MAG: hypothetical protein ACLQQ4_10190 [Bacteroidia bacterium]